MATINHPSSADAPITIRCSCGRKLKAPASMSGKRAKCPACGETITIGHLPDEDVCAPILSDLHSKDQRCTEVGGSQMPMPPQMAATSAQVRTVPATSKCERSGGDDDSSQLPQPSQVNEAKNEHPKIEVPVTDSPAVVPIPASLTCPNCGSEQTQKVSVIYEAGTQETESSFFGGGFAIGDNLDLVPALGGGTAASTSRSSLALRLSPPTPPATPSAETRVAFAQFAIVFLSSVVFFGIGSALDQDWAKACGLIVGIVAGLPVAALYKRKQLPVFEAEYKRIMNEYQSRQLNWDGEYFCHRCGVTFIPK